MHNQREYVNVSAHLQRKQQEASDHACHAQPSERASHSGQERQELSTEHGELLSSHLV